MPSLISKITCVPIQGKNRFIVTNATIKALKLLNWNDTSSSTEKSSSAAHNVASPVQEMVISKITSGSTQEKSRSSTRASHLKEQKRTHSGEKPYKCDHCNHSCTQAGSLNVHKRKHSREKPFKCGQCNFSCKIFGHLRKHVMKKHAAPPNV